jgi:hypothetical protein
MLIRKLGFGQKLASFLPFFVPLILVTPYFPGLLKQASIMAWMVGLPFFVLLYSRLDRSLLFLFIFLTYILLSSAQALQVDLYGSFVYLISLCSAPLMFNFFVGLDRKIDLISFNALSAFLFCGLATLIVFISISIGILDIEYFYSSLDKDQSLGLWRFSLGNAIEINVLFAALIFLIITDGNNHKLLPVVLILFLIIALLSQSRLVILIAILLSFVNKRAFLFSLLLIFIFVMFVDWRNFETILDYESLIKDLTNKFMFSGSDSSGDRLSLIISANNNLTWLNLLVGDGFMSSTLNNVDNYGGYRSIESSFLQVFYDFGLVGVILFFCSIKMSLIEIKSHHFLILSLFIIQLTIALPVFNYLPIIMGLLGLSLRRFRINE